MTYRKLFKTFQSAGVFREINFDLQNMLVLQIQHIRQIIYMYDHKLETFVSEPNRPMGRNPFRVLLVVSCPTYGQNMSLKAFNQRVGFPR